MSAKFVRSIAAWAMVPVFFATILTSTATAAQADSSSSRTLTAASNDMNGGVGAPMPDLKVTVSQTQGLQSQAIDVSWTGGIQSGLPSGVTGGSNFLQIAQCWGEDPLNPGHPDRTTCQYGSFGDKASATRVSNVECPIVGNVRQKGVIDSHDYPYTTGTDASYAVACPRGDPPATSIPFRAYGNAGTVASIFPDPAVSTGTVTRNSYEENTNPYGLVTIQKSGVTPVAGGVLAAPIQAIIGGTSQQVMGVNMATTPFYSKYTSNEIPWAGSGADGRGSVKFEVQTANENSSLGCGTPVPNIATGASSPQSCWLVIIPRGTKDSGSNFVTKPGLWWDAWKHNIAFKLDFNPTAQRCEVGGTEKRLSGSELIAGAVSSWQPSLCGGATGAKFSMTTGNEAIALTKASGTTPSPLALTTKALQTSGKDPLQYAPVALSGLAISFSIDRAAVDGIYAGHSTPATYISQNTTALTSMNLTPRLVAKLLTNSYWQSLPFGANLLHVGYGDANHPGYNAPSLVRDPDFLNKQSTDEWRYQYLNSPSLADLLTPNGQSDEATKLWEYALSDQEGRDFLAGKADEWGMVVNPYYSTSASTYSAGLTLPASNFPKADPATTDNHLPADQSQGNDSFNLLTFRPYTPNFTADALNVLRGDGQVLGNWNPGKKAYDKGVRDLPGTQKVLAVTTTEAAARFKNVTAALRNPAGQYVSPTTASMTAAAAAMVPSTSNSSIVGFDFSSAKAKAASGAYPLTMPVYAALNPLQSEVSLRASYATFIRYAVNNGQVPGSNPGNLPGGLAPIPQAWVTQALASATAIENGSQPHGPAVETTGSPTVAGAAQVGQTLTVTPGTWEAGVTFGYVWKRGGVVITGATAATYSLQAADVGQTVTVTVTGSKPTFISTSATSVPTATVVLGSFVASPSPTISGSAFVGQTLSVNRGLWSPAADGYTFAWKRGTTTIGGAVGSTYVLQDADAGQVMSVSVTGVRSGFVTVTQASVATNVVDFSSFISAPSPRITGTTVVGQALTAVTGVWSPVADSFTYAWKRSGLVIAGAVASTYVLKAGDVGQTLTVVVTGAKAGYSSIKATSVPTDVVDLASFVAATAPTVVGTVAVGQTLTAQTGTWSPVADSFTYVWKRGGLVIIGAAASTYVLQAADAGQTLTVTVTGAKPDYTSVKLASLPTDTVALGSFGTTPAPTIGGSAVAGQALTASAGTWSPAVDSTSFVWKRAGMIISGATGVTYVLSSADIGVKITVTVTGVKAGYASRVMTSVETAVVTAQPFVLSPVPSIMGFTAVGQTLTAVPGTWSPVALIVYVWKRSGVIISGATGSTYLLVAADVGTKITVEVSGTKAGYVATVKSSLATPNVDVGVFSMTPFPTITGTTTVGQTLTAVTGIWAPVQGSFTYVWKRAGVAIVGATSATYMLQAADAGQKIGVTVTGARDGYTSVVKASLETLVILRVFTATPVPTITGTAKVGQTLMAVAGTWAPAATFTYVWKRGGAVIVGATSSTYLAQVADATAKISVVVTGVTTGYAPLSKNSLETAAVVR